VNVVLSTNRNPNFITIAEYIDDAFRASGCETLFFDNSEFIIPGRIREKVRPLHMADLKRINSKLISEIKSFQPDLFVEAGGHRILPETVLAIKAQGISTVLWTIDPPIDFEPVLKAAPHYDFVFTGGSEAYDILKEKGIQNLSWLPFACDPTVHKPHALTEDEKNLYGTDIAFVGSMHPVLYPFRVRFLEAISDFNLAAWGPGSDTIPPDSPLKNRIRGEKTPPDTWIKIYSASKIVLCMHYRDPENRIPCHQASPRVYEALACGAFLMVDAQRDVLASFKDREELVIFRDAEELRELLNYYLERPEERRKVAEAGRKKALENHTYSQRITDMLKVVTHHG
jgi:spore maturation protein CgeB